MQVFVLVLTTTFSDVGETLFIRRFVHWKSCHSSMCKIWHSLDKFIYMATFQLQCWCRKLESFFLFFAFYGFFALCFCGSNRCSLHMHLCWIKHANSFSSVSVIPLYCWLRIEKDFLRNLTDLTFHHRGREKACSWLGYNKLTFGPQSVSLTITA